MKLTDEENKKKILRMKEIHPMRQKVGKGQKRCCSRAPEVFWWIWKPSWNQWTHM